MTLIEVVFCPAIWMGERLVYHLLRALLVPVLDERKLLDIVVLAVIAATVRGQLRSG